MKLRILLLLALAAALALGFWIVPQQGTQGWTVHDMELSVIDLPDGHTLTAAEMDVLLALPTGAPPPTGFTYEDQQWCQVRTTGALDPATGEAQITVNIRDAIADVDSVEVWFDGVLEHSASRTGGGGTFLDRGSLTYVTLSALVPTVIQNSASVKWYDALGNLQGFRELE